jgi:hypothetical protein
MDKDKGDTFEEGENVTGSQCLRRSPEQPSQP